MERENNTEIQLNSTFGEGCTRTDIPLAKIATDQTEPDDQENHIGHPSTVATEVLLTERRENSSSTVGEGDERDEGTSVVCEETERDEGVWADGVTKLKLLEPHATDGTGRREVGDEIEADSSDSEEEYVKRHSVMFYSWARFRPNAVRASEIKETFPEIHIAVIERCLAYLEKKGKIKMSDLSTKRVTLYDVIIPEGEKSASIQDIVPSMQLEDDEDSYQENDKDWIDEGIIATKKSKSNPFSKKSISLPPSKRNKTNKAASDPSYNDIQKAASTEKSMEKDDTSPIFLHVQECAPACAGDLNTLTINYFTL